MTTIYETKGKDKYCSCQLQHGPHTLLKRLYNLYSHQLLLSLLQVFLVHSDYVKSFVIPQKFSPLCISLSLCFVFFFNSQYPFFTSITSATLFFSCSFRFRVSDLHLFQSDSLLQLFHVPLVLVSAFFLTHSSMTHSLSSFRFSFYFFFFNTLLL